MAGWSSTKEYKTAWYRANKNKVNKQSRANYLKRADHYRQTARKRYREVRNLINQIKLEKGCIDCGYKEHACALDFDHLPGKKNFLISRLRKQRKEDILAEAANCEIRCANCHRVKHFGSQH